MIQKQRVCHPRRQHQRGNLLIEFCVSALILLAIFGGAADFGRLFYYSDLVTNAARAGTQYCVAQMSTGTCTSSTPLAWVPPNGIAAAAAAEPGDTNVTIGVATPVMTCLSTATPGGAFTTAACGGSGPWFETVTVNTSYTFNTVIAWPWVPQSIVLHGSSSVQVQ